MEFLTCLHYGPVLSLLRVAWVEFSSYSISNRIFCDQTIIMTLGLNVLNEGQEKLICDLNTYCSLLVRPFAVRVHKVGT